MLEKTTWEGTKIRISTLLILWVLFVGAVIADDGPRAGSPPLRDDGWQVGTLQKAGFNMEKLATLTDKLINDVHSNAHAVIVEHNGKLVYEQYLEGTDENWGSSLGSVKYTHDRRHDLRSISKSVTALLLGIALGDDFQIALNQPVLDFLPDHAGGASPGFEKVTLHHLLTMTAGFDWNEMDVPYSNSRNDEIQLYLNSANPIEFIVKKPMRQSPGETWYYNGGTTMLLAAVINRITGRSFLDYADEKFFKPLNISDYEWHGEQIWNQGYPAVASGLRLRARDLAKIGSLMLHNGKWNSRQIVPQEWISTSFVRHTEQSNSKWSFDGVYGYSYQWWHGEFDGRWGTFTALAGLGYGGQRLFIVPEKILQ